MASLTSSFAAELKHETASTRKLLERVPDAHLDWKPHAKSFSLRRLVSHLVDTVHWVGTTLAQSELRLDPATFKPWLAKDRAELVSRLDGYVLDALCALEGTPDAKLDEPWSLKVGDMTLFTMSKGLVLRTFVLNHHIHHRGQLTVYLRLKDVPLPQVYGPTADDAGMFGERPSESRAGGRSARRSSRA